MPFRTRGIVREAGAALAVLGLYFLVLLAPLHQAAGLQRSLAELGFATASDFWSICSQSLPSEDGDSTAVAKCAVAGLGKNQALPVDLATIVLAPPAAAAPVIHAGRAPDRRELAQAQPGQPRAPPAVV